MLSIDRCRQLLGSTGQAMTDAQVERLRDQLYGLADFTVSVFLKLEDARSDNNTLPTKRSSAASLRASHLNPLFSLPATCRKEYYKKGAM